MTERETDGDQTLHGSLHSLRSEYEEIREIRRTRRYEMPEAQVKMNVRKAERPQGEREDEYHRCGGRANGLRGVRLDSAGRREHQVQRNRRRAINGLLTLV